MNPIISIYPPFASFGSAGGWGTITITCGPDDVWVISAFPTWVSVPVKTGKGSAVVKYFVAANNMKHGHHVKSSPRTGILTFGQPAIIEPQGLDAVTVPTIFVDSVTMTFEAACKAAAPGNTIRLMGGKDAAGKDVVNEIIADGCVVPQGVKVIGDGRGLVRLVAKVGGSNRVYCEGDNVFAGFTSELALEPKLTALNLSVLNVDFVQAMQQDAIHSGISKGARWYFENCTFKSGYDTFNVNGPMGMSLAEMPLVIFNRCTFAVKKSATGNSDMGRAIRAINCNFKIYNCNISVDGFTGINEVDGPDCGVCISILDSQSRVEVLNSTLIYTPGAHPVIYVNEVPAQYNLASGDPNGVNLLCYGVPPNPADVVGGKVMPLVVPNYNFQITQA